MNTTDPHILAAAAALRPAELVVALTGAGVSAESGLPTFREAQTGLWARYRPEDLATPEAFARDPRLVWEWYAWRRALVAAAAPNPAHHALARLEQRLPGFTLVTQNVDGLHHRAAEALAGGSEAARAYPLEVHGAIHRDRCSECGARRPGVTDIDTTSVETLPRCDACGGLLRPDVVWFGEPLDASVLGAAFAAAEAADLCLVVGTSSLVYPAAAVPEIASRAGAALIEVNPEETPLSALAAVTLRAGAATALPALLGPAPCGTAAER
jgi:NAD-dependent deacetylase